MKTRVPLLLVFAATLSLQGPAIAHAVNTEVPDIVPTPVPTPQAAPAAPAPPAATAPASPAPARVSKLSKSEAAARLKALPEEERKWVEDYVAPIILPEERNLFLQLEAHQYEGFKKDFWARREQPGLPLPLGPGYRNRYDSYRDLAATTYGGLKSDTGKMVILHGEPQSVQEYPNCSNVFVDIAIWTYFKQNASGIHSDIRYLFYRQNPSAGSWKLWMPMMPDRELLAPSSCLPNIAAACRQAGSPISGGASINSPTSFCPNNAAPQTCEQACEVVAAIQSIRLEGDGAVAASIAEPPKVEVEGLDKLTEQYPQVGDSKAKALSIQGPADAAAPSPPPRPTTAQASASPAPKTPPHIKQLSKSEAAARLKALPEEERKWLEEYVAPIILPEERNLFLQLEAHQYDTFKKDFWARREQPGLAPPLGPGYEHRYDSYRDLAATTYGGLKSETGKMVILRGEPASIQEYAGGNDSADGGLCNDTFRNLAVWTYTQSSSSGFHKEARFLFYRMNPSAGSWKLWLPMMPESELLAPSSCLPSIAEACRRPGTPGPVSAGCTTNVPKTCDQACDVVAIVQSIRQEGDGFVTAAISVPPKVEVEGLDKLAEQFPQVQDTKATPLSAQGPSGDAVVPTSPSAKATDKSADKTADNSGPAPAHRKLSKKEINQLTEALPLKYKDFLTLVELIITPDEREIFLEINENYQRDKFIDNFWRRRTIDSMGIRTDYRAVYTRRVQQAIDQFGDLHNDRAKMFVLDGPPDAVIPIDCDDVYVPIQIWYYERLEVMKSKAYLIFYEPYGMPPFKLWIPMDGIKMLLVGGGDLPMPGMPIIRRNPANCLDNRAITDAIQYTTQLLGAGPLGMSGAASLFQRPTVETEGVDQILSMTTDLHQGSTDLAVAKLVRFPEMRGSKMGVDLSLLVPKAELKPRTLGEESFFNVDIIGEVVKDDRLIDNFKYRFDIPTSEIGGEKIPLTVRRYLYPGSYKLVLKISDGNQNAEGRLSEALTVPEQADAPPPEVVAARAEGKAAVNKMKEEGFVASAVSIQPIAKEIVTGLQRFETKVAEGVHAVDFYLNGTKVMTRTRAPYDADLNLGPLPRKQTIRVVAYGPTGRTVGEDEYIVNEGKEIFKVRILTPEKGAKASGPTKVVAAVAVPEGKNLQKLEFYSNDARVATLYQTPFEQTINIKDSKSLGYVRIVGTLDDGTVGEDVRYINAPQYVSEVTVDAVELYTTVTEKGHPVNYLQASNFKVLEDGVLQKIEGFEYVKNLPLSVGIMIDTSASMLESLPEAEQAGLKFIDFTIGEKDRGFVVSFDNEPYLLAKMTGRKDKLIRAFSGLRAEGSTALYDAIIYGLYQFTGIKGKKALVVVTDGKDTASKFDYDTLVEYVKKSGIAIYGIGLKISGTDLEVKYKLNHIAQATGGQTFYIDSAKNLENVYRQINEDLRSQYLLTYYSSNTEAKDQWRKVEVKVEPTNLSARTISGYYP